jgi:hypothetical protein
LDPLDLRGSDSASRAPPRLRFCVQGLRIGSRGSNPIEIAGDSLILLGLESY